MDIVFELKKYLKPKINYKNLIYSSYLTFNCSNKSNNYIV